MEREGWDSGMKELLADFKVAYATTEPRLRVDVRMFSLYLIWMSTRGCRLCSAALFGTVRWLRWCGFELFKVLKSLVSLAVRLPRKDAAAGSKGCSEMRSSPKGAALSPCRCPPSLSSQFVALTLRQPPLLLPPPYLSLTPPPL